MSNTKESGNIKFKLDNNWEGEGKVVGISKDQVCVKLTKPCKEFEEGTEIFVSKSEIIY